MEFTRTSVIKHLEKHRGLTPVDSGYKERVEEFILFHFDILEGELADKKKFKGYCATFVSKTKDYYRSNKHEIDRMLDDDSHKVVLLHSVVNHLNQKNSVLEWHSV